MFAKICSFLVRHPFVLLGTILAFRLSKLVFQVLLYWAKAEELLPDTVLTLFLFESEQLYTFLISVIGFLLLPLGIVAATPTLCCVEQACLAIGCEGLFAYLLAWIGFTFSEDGCGMIFILPFYAAGMSYIIQIPLLLLHRRFFRALRADVPRWRIILASLILMGLPLYFVLFCIA